MWEELVTGAFIPAIRKSRENYVRRQKLLDPSYNPPDDMSEVLSALLTMDGAFSELEATVTLTEELTAHFVEIFKFPGGCSVSFQPNDLMRGFMLFRSKMCTPPVKELPRDCWPDVAVEVFGHLTSAGMDKASVVLFCENYFCRLKEVFTSSFGPEIILEGYRISGLYPYNEKQMLKSCPVFASLPQEEADQIIPGINVLVNGDNSDLYCDIIPSIQ